MSIRYSFSLLPCIEGDGGRDSLWKVIFIFIQTMDNIQRKFCHSEIRQLHRNFQNHKHQYVIPISIRILFCLGEMEHKMKRITHLHQEHILGIHGALPPLPHTSSWYGTYSFIWETMVSSSLLVIFSQKYFFSSSLSSNPTYYEVYPFNGLWFIFQPPPIKFIIELCSIQDSNLVLPVFSWNTLWLKTNRNVLTSFCQQITALLVYCGQEVDQKALHHIRFITCSRLRR